MKPYKVAIKILAEDKKKRILLVKRNFPPDKDCWDIPGGRIEDSEDVEIAGKREFMEETNLDVEIHDFIGSAISEGPNFKVIGLIFTGKILGGDLKLDGEEVSDYKWVSKSELLKQKKLRPQFVKVFKEAGVLK